MIRMKQSEGLFYKMKKYKERVHLLLSLIKNYYVDCKLFYKHSNIFKQDTFGKIEALIILRYHSLEKGFLHDTIRYEFGKNVVIELAKLLKREDVIANCNRSQIKAAYMVMCNYYTAHSEKNVDISSYYPKSDYDFFSNMLALNFSSVNDQQASSYFDNSDKDFYHFSKSRCSMRDFTGEMVSFETIEKVIEIAKTAPSVCNRQPVKVYFVEDKKIIDAVFAIQKGLKGYSDNVSQLFVVVSNRNYFYKVGERNQLFIDGGIFVMNLLYALHYYKIGACPAHWGFNTDTDQQIKKLLNMTESEKVICLVPIGIPQNKFKTTLSLRRSNDEILKRIT